MSTLNNLAGKIEQIKSNSFVVPGAARVLRNAYLLLSITMLPTILGAYLGSLFPIYSYLGAWLPILLFFGGLFWFSGIISRNKNSVTGIYWLLFFTLFVGYFFGPALGVALGSANGFKVVLSAIGGTAALFLILSGYAKVTERNFSQHSLGISLTIGLVLMIIMGLVNFFLLQMPALALALSALILIISSLFIIYDTNKVIRGGETNYIIVAMSFYVSIINIFSSLMNLLSFFNSDE